MVRQQRAAVADADKKGFRQARAQIAGFGGMVAIMALMLGNLVPNQTAAIQQPGAITAPVAQPPEPVQMPASTSEP